MTDRARAATHSAVVRARFASVLLFALPIMGGTVLQSLNASVNAMWIGHFLGESALSAVSNASLIVFLLLTAVFGVSMASTILVGQSLGARNMVEAKRVVGTGVSFFVALSTLVSLLGYEQIVMCHGMIQLHAHLALQQRNGCQCWVI